MLPIFLMIQLENFQGDDSVYEERISRHVLPCLSQLVAASQDDSMWKTINYQVLLNARHVSPKVPVMIQNIMFSYRKASSSSGKPSLEGAEKMS